MRSMQAGRATIARNCVPALDKLRKGDTFVVYKLDRLGRSLRSLITFVEDPRQRGVEFKSISDMIDTSTPAGRFFFGVLAALAEMERDLARERTKAGLSAARVRGRKGRCKPILTPPQIDKALHMLQDRTITVTEVAAKLKVNRSTIYRALGIAGQG